MNKLTKKIVAIVTTVTVGVWLIGPGVANALTAAELQVLINDLLTQIATLQSQLAGMDGGGGATISGCTITSFDRSLKVGMSGDDAKCLQIVLNTASDTQVASTGVGSPGNETSYFGPLTMAAVVKFQEKYASDILATYGLTSGTGFVGTTTKAKLNELLSAGAGAVEDDEVTEEDEEGEVSTGTASVTLSSASPDATQIALNARDAIFTKIKFSGGDEGVTITRILVKRSGIAADADISSLKLYDGTTRVGSSQALNTNTHKATFSSLSWEIPAGTTKVLTIKGSIAASGTATVGDSIKLGIASASDITSTGTLAGTFPIYGASKTIAGISVGAFYVAKQGVPAANDNMLSGSVDQEIASWKFSATGTEGMSVESIKITHTGSATRDDVLNIKLMLSGVQIGETVASFDSQNSATFDVSGELDVIASGVKTVYAYADVASGVWTARNIIFEISQYTDVVAYGTNSGGAVEIETSYNTAFTRQTGATMTIGQGSLTVTVDASLNPAAQNYVKGTEGRLISAFKFSPGSVEGIRVSQLKLRLSTTAGATDVSNVTLWDGSTQIAGPASVIGAYVTFGSYTVGWDTVGLFDVEKGSTKTVQVKADIPNGATVGNHDGSVRNGVVA